MAAAKPSSPGRKVPAASNKPAPKPGKSYFRNERGQPVERTEGPKGLVFDRIIFEADYPGDSDG